MLQHINLDTFLSLKGYNNFEGNCSNIPKQQEQLKELAQQPNVKRILEIGFNAGHSSEVFLNANPDAEVVSFDLGAHEYVKVAKEYIDLRFPNRHSLHLGTSLETIPAYSSSHPNETFDLIFIDGCHEFDYALMDMINCKKLAHPESILVLDDTMFQFEHALSWNAGPTMAWLKLVSGGFIKQESHAVYATGRGQSVGRYSFP